MTTVEVDDGEVNDNANNLHGRGVVLRLMLPRTAIVTTRDKTNGVGKEREWGAVPYESGIRYF